MNFGQIQDPGLNDLLGKRLNLPPGPASTIAPEVFPVFPAGNWTSELDYLIGRRNATAWASISGVAAQYSQMRLANLSGSGILLNVTGALITCGSASAVIIGPNTTTTSLGTTQRSGPNDTRFQVGTSFIQTASQFTSRNSVTQLWSAGGQMQMYFVVPGTSLFVPLQYTISPRFSLDIECATVNVSMTVTLFFNERTAQPGELV